MTDLPITTNAKDAIHSSWVRCERQYNLKRDAARPILRLQTSEVAPRLEAMIERTGGRHGIFRQLATLASEAGHCLVITDNDGILVRLENKAAEADWNGIALGSVWDERIAGTNGVSMALAEGRDFTVRGSDHYYSQLQAFACSATPLRNSENEIIGVANLSAIDRGNPADALFAQQLLSAAAHRLQHALFERDFRDLAIVSVAIPTRRDLVKGSELVAVNERGVIQAATTDAHKISGVASHSELRGQPFDAVFGTDVESLDRVPGRVMSIRRDRGPMLDLWTRAPIERIKPFVGVRSRRPTLRRRLLPSLKELSIGSVAMANLCERAQTSLAHRYPLLIEGATGTGKSALVAALTDTVGPKVVVDCAALEDTEDDRDYFQALMQQMRFAGGLIHNAEPTAVLVLDNLSELPPYAQTSLRHVLEAFETKDGPGHLQPLVIGTSRAQLRFSMEQGEFRDDLYYLLAGTSVMLPPLRDRERPDALAKALAGRIAGYDVDVSRDACDLIVSYDWPGNVRELRNALRQALLNGDGATITALDLCIAADPTASLPRNLTAWPTLDEKDLILDALQGARWNVAKAARNLGIGRATIHRKMKALGISRPA